METKAARGMSLVAVILVLPYIWMVLVPLDRWSGLSLWELVIGVAAGMALAVYVLCLVGQVSDPVSEGLCGATISITMVRLVDYGGVIATWADLGFVIPAVLFPFLVASVVVLPLVFSRLRSKRRPDVAVVAVSTIVPVVLYVSVYFLPPVYRMIVSIRDSHVSF